MKLYDISVPLSTHVPIFPGDPSVGFEQYYGLEDGDVCNLTIYNFGSHSATHMDAPLHFLQDGKSVTELPIERFMGEALVVDARGRSSVTADFIKPLDIKEGVNVLFLTDNGNALLDSEFKKDFVYISPDAAQLLVDKKVNMVGIDYLSVEQYGADDFAAHKILLANEIILLEGICLDGIEPGEYTLFAFPISICGANGSPVRAVLGR